MTNDDKQFLKGLITDLDQKWDKRFQSLESELTGVKSEITGIKGEITGVKDEIRYSGILIERLQDDVTFLSKVVHEFNTKLSEVRSDVAEIKENTFDLLIIRKLVQKHERQLAKMR